MRLVFITTLMLCSLFGHSQNETLAKHYFDQGAFDKALPLYENLYQNNPNNNNVFLGYVATLQQLEQFETAKTIINNRLFATQHHPIFLIEMGRNYFLQRKPQQAHAHFEKAIDALSQNPQLTHTVGNAFARHSLLDWAIKAYQRGKELDPNINVDSPLARIYGEQGNLEKMFNSFLNIIENNPTALPNAQRTFAQYITENPSNEANTLLRNNLLRRAQNNPDVMYNHLLSWLFIQQKQYDQAFRQERAIFRRDPQNLNQIKELAQIAMQDKDYPIAKEIATFILENTDSQNQQLQAHQQLMQIQIATATPENYAKVAQNFEALIEQFHNNPRSLNLKLDYNRFLAQQMQNPSQAIINLRTLNQNSNHNRFQQTHILMLLADLLVTQEKFNEALIYYSKIQHLVPNDPLAQEARFKVARTSYFKGDFDWAQTQLTILKTATSQLIANDAMELSLIISDNTWGEVSTQALKKYAQADLFKLQGSYQKAIDLLNQILAQYQGQPIEDEALYLQAKVFEQMQEPEKAISNYKKIITYHSHDVLVDKAYFYLAQLYHHTLNQPEKAKQYYEQIIFNHQDSIYFVEARRQYRSIRGDFVP